MAIPVPINEAGLRGKHYFDTATFAPVWDIPQQTRPTLPTITPDDRSPFKRESLLLVSGLTGGLAIVSALGLWPALAATSLGLDEQGAFYLMVFGVYLLATTLYAAWRTRLLHNMGQAPWDARLMAYANLGVGGAVMLILGVIALAVVGIVMMLVWLGALLLSGVGGPPQD
jgi:hypothetical protein